MDVVQDFFQRVSSLIQGSESYSNIALFRIRILIFDNAIEHSKVA